MATSKMNHPGQQILFGAGWPFMLPRQLPPEARRAPVPVQRWAQYDQVTKERVLGALRVIAGMCDGGVMRDGMGFGKIDVQKGHDLASKVVLSNGECWLGLRLLGKYHRQVPQEFGDLVMVFGPRRLRK